jgi:hypothetical protein
MRYGQNTLLVEAKENIYAKVPGEEAEVNSDIGFEDVIDGDPDCKVLSVERASRREPEHKAGAGLSGTGIR